MCILSDNNFRFADDYLCHCNNLCCSHMYSKVSPITVVCMYTYTDNHPNGCFPTVLQEGAVVSQ